jgi:hypothetical protein
MERWRTVQEFPDYEVSDFGRIRNKHTGVVLKPLIDKGYQRVNVYRSGKLYRKSIHRLVLFAFIPNDDPEKKVQVNHIDGNKTNNNLHNLEWCTRSENITHAIKTGLQTRFGRQRNVIQMSKDGKIIARYSSARDAERKTGIKESKISCVCTGKKYKRKDGYHEKRYTAGGFKWAYE